MASGAYTGYIHDLLDKNMNLKQFTFACAASFGYLVNFRDQDLKGNLPKSIPINRSTLVQISKTKKEIKRLKGLSKQAQIDHGNKEKCRLLKFWEKYEKIQQKEQDKLRSMLSQVESWNPPTKNHQGLKGLMLQQIKDALGNSDTYCSEEMQRIGNQDPIEFITKELDHTVQNLRDLEHEWAREQRWNRESNEWLSALKKSFKGK